MPVEITQETEWTQTLRLQDGALDGTLVTLEVDEEFTQVTAFNADRREIGQLRFRLIEGDHFTQYYKLIWAFLDRLDPQYTHQGLGRAALQFWRKCSGEMAAAVERHTGIPNEEGSELTGDAPTFVARMVDEGLLYYEDGGD